MEPIPMTQHHSCRRRRNSQVRHVGAALSTTHDHDRSPHAELRARLELRRVQHRAPKFFDPGNGRDLGTHVQTGAYGHRIAVPRLLYLLLKRAVVVIFIAVVGVSHSAETALGLLGGGGGGGCGGCGHSLDGAAEMDVFPEVEAVAVLTEVLLVSRGAEEVGFILCAAKVREAGKLSR